MEALGDLLGRPQAPLGQVDFNAILWDDCPSINQSSQSGGIGSLEDTIPGTPGEDYPIYAVPPETSFSCDGQVDGGYYGDPEAECQVI